MLNVNVFFKTNVWKRVYRRKYLCNPFNTNFDGTLYIAHCIYIGSFTKFLHKHQFSEDKSALKHQLCERHTGQNKLFILLYYYYYYYLLSGINLEEY